MNIFSSRKIFKIIIISTLVFSLLSIPSLGESQNVTVSITPKPKIDIVLAKTRTKTDLTNFEGDILNGLKSKSVDTSDVKVSSIQSEQVDLQNSFTWKQDIDSSIGNITIANSGKDVTMVGNPSLPGKNAIYIIPDKENEDQQFTFGYNIDFGDSFNAAGMLLRVKETNASTHALSGYCLSFNQAGHTFATSSNNANGAIWKFVYDGNNTTNMNITLVQQLTINTSGTLTVKATDSEISIIGDSSSGLTSEVVCPVDSSYTTGNGYGFFSDHYSHGCQRIGSFALTNINLQTTTTKKFDEVLRQPEWRAGSLRFLVNVSDVQNKELASSSTYGELTTRLMNDDIYFVAWGQDINKEQFSNLITQNSNKGIFINNTNYNSSIDSTATYIKSLLDGLSSSEYVIVNEPVTITVNPESARNNTADSTWPYGKWKMIHDYEYFENNNGQFAESGKYIPDFISTFDKVGRFEITYEDNYITPKYIYVHRRPVASFKMVLNNGNVTLTSNSYDLDKQSDNNGISEEAWSWKTSDQTSWTHEKLTSYDSSKTYLIQLRVKDFQNTWSVPTTKYIYNGSDALPVAMFTVKNETFTKYEKLEVEDQSYDPGGKSITGYKWEIHKDSNLVYSGSTIPTDYRNYELGDYTISLTVTNSSGATSESVSRTFTITNDTIAPEVTVTPVDCNWTKSQDVKLAFTDKGGSNFKNYKYAITDSQATPSNWSSEIAKANDTITINSNGTKYLHIIAEDNAGNVSKDRITGPYKIDNTGPTISVTADLTTITTEPIDLKANVTDSLSGVKSITINGESYKNDSVYKLTTNGTYTIVAIDNVGNQTKKEVVVTNKYVKCTAGLDHPIYSSSYSECPICKLLKNIKITNTSFTYDGTTHRVNYQNPDNSTIVEYYNGSKTVPSKVGSYTYELKVVYNGEEYKSQFSGTETITKKDITISNITADNRQYDGTNIVAIHNGKLNGIETVDNGKVSFTLPQNGTTPSKDIGTYNVTIPTIVLTGTESSNYNLIQPNIKDVSVTITPKDITISNITADNRQYDGTNIVKIHNGRLNGIESVDNGKVDFILPKTGTIPNKDIGNYNVTIPEVILTGDECSNYNLLQPNLTDVSVKITPKNITINDIYAEDRQYDGTNIVKIHGGKLNGIEKIDDGKV